MGVWSSNFGNYRLTKPRMGRLPRFREPSYDELRKNWAIQSLQRELLYRGYDPLRYEGVYTRSTKKAVMAFQTSRGLRADGEETGHPKPGEPDRL